MTDPRQHMEASQRNAPSLLEEAVQTRQALEQLKAQLRESETRYRTLFESLDEGFCIIEKVEGEAGAPPDFRFVEANPAFAAHSGLSSMVGVAGVVGKTMRQLFPGEAEGWLPTYDAICRTGEPIRFERDFVTLGRVLELYAFRIADQTHCRVAVNFHDITGRKRAEAALARLAMIVESSDDAIISKSIAGVIQTWNAGAERMFGYRSEEVVGKPITLLIPPERLPEEEYILQQLRRGKAIDHYETQRLTRDGRCIDVSLTISPLKDADGKVVGASKIIRNITERKQAEDALRQSEAFSRSIIKSSADCIKVLDLAGNLLSMESGQELLGIEDIQPFLNKSWLDFWTSADRPAAHAAVASAAAGGAGSFVGFFRTLRGEPKWWDVTISPILDANGKPARLLAVSRDVTQRQQADEVLRQRTAQFEALLNEAPLGVYLVDADFRIRQVNPSALQVFGNIPELSGRDFAEVMHILWPQTRADEVIQRFRHTLETGEPCFVPEMIEQRADRETIEYYEWQISRIPLPDGRHGVVCYFRDISGRVLAQQKIRDSEERYHNLFNAIDEGFCVIDMIFDEHDKPVDFRFLEVNPAFEKQSGIRDATGRRMREIAPDIEAHWSEICGKVALTGEPVRYVNEAKALNDRWFDIYAFRIGGPESRKVAVIFNNITERKLAEESLRESEQRLRTLVTASADVMYRMSPDWREMRQLHGQNFLVDTAAPSDNWLQEYIHPDDQQRVLAGIHEAIRTKSLFEMEHQVRTMDGSLGWTFSRAVPLLDATGDITEWFGTASDVTEHKRAEQALHESEERYRNLFNSIDEGFAILEIIFDEEEQALDYRFLEVNPAFGKQTGILDATGKRIREISPDQQAPALEIYSQVLQTGEPVRFVNEVKALGRYFDVYATRLGGPENRKIAVVFNNITARKEAEETLHQSEERLRLAAEAAHFGMYDRSLDGTDFHLSGQLKHMLGYQPDAPLGHEQTMSHFHPDDQAAGKAAFQRACDPGGDGQIAVEQRIVRRDGTVRWIASVGRVLFEDGVPRRSIGFWIDITERKRLEQQALKQAQALAELDRRKDEFLAMLSHELRNPLAALSNAAQLLRLQKSEGPLLLQGRSIIERQVGQLTHLVDDLLEVSRITRGSVRLRQQTVNLSGIVERALETAQPMILQHRHQLTLALPPEPIFLHADAARLEQVLVNLLTNAAKYTDDGGRIDLSVEQEDDQVVIRVRDNGIGIEPALLPHIFDLFTQAERSLDRAQGGLGIGLSLVRRLVELHGGSVLAHSVLGQGSEFVVRLPVLPLLLTTLPESPTALTSPNKAATGCRVLVVDDNVDAAQSLAQLLERTGHKTRLAYDGPSALQAAMDYLPEVVLLDIGLPGLDGYEVAERIRQQATLKHTVLVALTGYGQDSDRQRSQEAGFDHHLVKPSDFDEIENILAGVASLRKA